MFKSKCAHCKDVLIDTDSERLYHRERQHLRLAHGMYYNGWEWVKYDGPLPAPDNSGK